MVSISRRAAQSLKSDPRLARRIQKIADQIESDVKAAAPVHDPSPQRINSYPGRPSGTLRNALQAQVRVDAKTTSGFSIRVSAPTDREVLKWVTKGRQPLVVRAKDSNPNGLFFFATKTNQFYGLGNYKGGKGLRAVVSGPIAPNSFLKDTVDPILRANRATRKS